MVNPSSESKNKKMQRAQSFHLQALVSYSKFCNMRLSHDFHLQETIKMLGVQTWSTLQTFENNNNFQRQECQLKGFRRRKHPNSLAQGIAQYPFGLWAMAGPKPCIHAHMEEHDLLSKQLPFISVCILRDLPQQKNPRLLCQRSSPNCTCSHVPMEKEARKSKESYLHKGRFLLYSCILLRFGNSLSRPSLRRTHSYGNLPYKLALCGS